MKKPLSKLAVPVLALPRPAKRFVALMVDLSLCVFGTHPTFMSARACDVVLNFGDLDFRGKRFLLIQLE